MRQPQEKRGVVHPECVEHFINWGHSSLGSPERPDAEGLCHRQGHQSRPLDFTGSPQEVAQGPGIFATEKEWAIPSGW